MSAPKLSRLGAAALGYAKHGIPVFPCEPQGKAPLTPNGFKAATTDHAQVVEWWTATPNANIGGVVGAAGYVGVDCDDPERGKARARELGLLAEPAPTVTTGRGWHRYYRANGTAVRPQQLGECLEIKGQGGYFILPPSRHPSGVLYRWAGPERLADAPLLPPRVVEALAEPPTPAPAADNTLATFHEGQRNRALASLAGAMRRPGMTVEEIAAALLEVNARRCRPPLSEAEVRKIAGSIAQYEPATGSGDTADPRPIILIRPELTAMVDEAIDAIAQRPDLGVYVRARMLVTIARDGSPRDRWVRRQPGAPVIVPVDHARMMGLLDRAARWTKPDKRKGRDGCAPAVPPALIATQLVARTEWPLRYLEAVIETPTIRADGTILDQPGYDEATCVMFEPAPGSAACPPIPEHPTPEDVRAALETLLAPVVDFPFVSSTDQAAYVAAVLTLLARHIIDGPTPMFPVRAPTPGTGKGLLASVIGLIGTGRAPAVMSMVEPDELRKRITALAVAGTPLVLLDDVSGSLGSNVLAAALTATWWEDRLLGQTEMVRLPLRIVWLATGNNLGFQRTLGRRVIPIDLNARLEHPEDRTTFQHPDLLGFVRGARPRLVAAALTITRGFVVAGRPAHGKAKLGSFERWDDLIRGAVIWAGLNDPAAADDPTRGRGRIRAQADDDIEDLVALHAELHRVFKAESWTAGEAWHARETDEALKAALAAAAVPRRDRTKSATLESLRFLLRSVADRPIRGFVLTRASSADQRQQRWCIRPIDRIEATP